MSPGIGASNPDFDRQQDAEPELFKFFLPSNNPMERYLEEERQETDGDVAQDLISRDR